MEQQISKRQVLEHMLIEKAMKDEQFRKLLMESPREALESELGIRFPPEFQIHVLQEDQANVYLVLPSVSAMEDTNTLTDAELQGVGGGAYTDNATCWCNSYFIC